MNTPLHATAQYGYTTIMELLLENGATVDIRNTDDGWTPLHNAAAGGKVKSIELLLKNGADINVKSFIGETPLHFAASQGRKEAVVSLVTNGASLVARDDNGKTAHEIAIVNNHSGIAKYLDEKTIHKTLFQAAKDNDIHSLNKHIAANSNLNQKETDSWTALHFSAYYGYLEFAELLINNNASIDAKHNLGWTALHIASWQGHLEIVQTLISNGASINAKVNNDERTALHIAVMYGHYEIAKTLIENGIDVHSDTFLGETALDMAIRKDLVKIQELIKDQTLIISAFKYSGQFQFDINGMKGGTFLIEASTDLKLWDPVGEFKNRDGVVKFSDRTSPLFDQQFYRVKVVE